MKTDPISPGAIAAISELLVRAWSPPPAERAAKSLRDAGFNSNDLWRFNKTEVAKILPDHWKNNTLNEMRDLERLCATDKTASTAPSARTTT